MGVVCEKQKREGCSLGSESGLMEEEQLPSEIILDGIMSRLPVKPLVSFRSVCKTFNSIISSDPRFSILQLKNSSITRTCFDRQRVLLWNSRDRFLAFFLEKKNSTEFSIEKINTSPIAVDEAYPCSYSVVASCDGLVCIFNLRTSSILFWNPLTGETKRVSDPPTGIPILSSACGLGYDSSTDDYKLVWFNPRRNEVGVFSLGTNSWRRIQYLSTNKLYYRKPCVFINGALYSIGFSKDSPNDRYKLVSFCLETEKYTLLDIPAIHIPLHNSDIGFQILGNKLAIYYPCNLDGSYCLLFRNLGDNSESWVIHMVIIPNSRFFIPLCLLENVDEILFRGSGAQLGVYHLTLGTFRYLYIPGLPKFVQATTFSESLISPSTYKGTKIWC